MDPAWISTASNIGAVGILAYIALKLAPHAFGELMKQMQKEREQCATHHAALLEKIEEKSEAEIAIAQETRDRLTVIESKIGVIRRRGPNPSG